MQLLGRAHPDEGERNESFMDHRAGTCRCRRYRRGCLRGRCGGRQPRYTDAAGTASISVAGGSLTVIEAAGGTGWTVLSATGPATHVEVQFSDTLQLVTFSADLVGDDVVVSLTNVAVEGAPTTVAAAPINVTVITTSHSGSAPGSTASQPTTPAPTASPTTPAPAPAAATPAASTTAAPATAQPASTSTQPAPAATTAPSGGGDDDDDDGDYEDDDHEDEDHGDDGEEHDDD